MEGKTTVPSKTKSDNRMEFGLGFSDELLRTSLMVVWDLMKPSWCPIPNADLILRATHGIQRELYADGNLRDLNIIYNLMTTSSRSNRENNVELPCWGAEDWIEPSDTCETAQAIDDTVWKYSDESENVMRANCRLPWRN